MSSQMSGDSMNGYTHEPVMAREVVELLSAVPPGLVVDATVGGGGHSRQLLEARPDLQVLGIDRDAVAVAAAREALAPFGKRARVVHGGFERLGDLVEAGSEGKVMGILFDLGTSSPQLDRRERGFSYWDDAPLDMRMDGAQVITAEQVVNTYDEERLAQLILDYGEEPLARSIAAAIVRERPLHTTGDLVRVIKDALPASALRRRGHPARRAFQAIRMEVNRELPNLAEGLDESVTLLGPGGRVVALSYHSLEDRVVKGRLSAWAATSDPVPPGMPVERPRRALVRLLTRRPLRPTPDEIAHNPRARSARLRAAERLGAEGAGVATGAR